jgi:O-antigen/teichoic acid export membrane protein
MHTSIPELDRTGLRRFALTTGAIVALLFGLLLPWLIGIGLPLWPWIIAGILVVWGMAAPGTLRPLYRGWMRFGLLASRVTTPLLMGLVFFARFLPMGMALRLAGKDPMRRRREPDAASYREPSEPKQPRAMERPY